MLNTLLTAIGIFYLICVPVTFAIIAYEMKTAPIVPQEIDIFDL